MAQPESPPAAFDDESGADKYLAAAKKRAATKFSWRKQAALDNAMRLAYWLYVFGREDEALEVCRFLGTFELAGNFNLWSSIEFALALNARLSRLAGRRDEAAECVRRIRAAGFVASRLQGGLLDDKLERIARAAGERDRTGERDWSLNALLELCALIELGGSEARPVAELERDFQRIVTRLRELLGVA
jgi:hypothetical protein